MASGEREASGVDAVVAEVGREEVVVVQAAREAVGVVVVVRSMAILSLLPRLAVPSSPPVVPGLTSRAPCPLIHLLLLLPLPQWMVQQTRLQSQMASPGQVRVAKKVVVEEVDGVQQLLLWLLLQLRVGGLLLLPHLLLLLPLL